MSQTVATLDAELRQALLSIRRRRLAEAEHSSQNGCGAVGEIKTELQNGTNDTGNRFLAQLLQSTA